MGNSWTRQEIKDLDTSFTESCSAYDDSTDEYISCSSCDRSESSSSLPPPPPSLFPISNDILVEFLYSYIDKLETNTYTSDEYLRVFTLYCQSLTESEKEFTDEKIQTYLMLGWYIASQTEKPLTESSTDSNDTPPPLVDDD